jgi:hypothetical protein
MEADAEKDDEERCWQCSREAASLADRALP